jgi:predicted nucleic acid-binding Zn ribbon protein
MDSFFKTLPTVLRAAGQSPEVVEAAVFAAWKHAAGEGLRQHAVPTKLVNKTLIVAVADAVWQKQLGAMKGQLLFRTNTLLGQPLLSQIELLIEPQMVKRPAPKTAEAEITSNEVPLELWSAANEIHDKELRRSFLKAAMSSLQRSANQNE